MKIVALAIALFALLPVSKTLAVSTQIWETKSYSQFMSGRLKRVVLSSKGRLSLGYEAKKIKTDNKTRIKMVWSLIHTRSGTTYVGTGEKGGIYRLRDNKLQSLTQGELVFTCFAEDDKGAVFAGSIPNGKIFRIDPSGAVALFATLKAKYIWSLVAASDGLYAATGPKGKIFKVDAQGKAKVFYDAKEQHIMSLALDNKTGNLYAGSSKKGILYRISPKGKAFALHDFTGDEVKAIVLHKDVLYVAVNRAYGTSSSYFRPSIKRKGRTLSKALSRLTKLFSRKKKVRRRFSFLKRSSYVSSRLGKGEVYRIDALGRVERLFYLPGGYVTALKVGKNDNIYVATGAKGRVYKITPRRVIYTLFDLKEKKVLALTLKDGRPHLMGTAGGGALYVSTGKAAEKGSYFSRVFNAGFPSRWGRIFWRAKGKVKIRTRSGNTIKPEKMWSDWSDEMDTPRSKIESPPARFLQFRVDFDDDPSVRLKEVKVYYLPQNQQHRITFVSVGKSRSRIKSSFFSLFSRLRKKRKKRIKAPTIRSTMKRHSPLKKISWSVTNPDGDKLSYRVYMKRRGSTQWIALTRKEPTTSIYYYWKTQNMPDGHYKIKVVASDTQANPQGQELKHTKVSEWVLVDNTKPEIKDFEVESDLTVKGEVVDALSVITRIEYNIDGGKWRLVYPEDLIFDDLKESFKFKLKKKLAKGEHVLGLRAYDSDGNMATASKMFNTP